MQWTCVTCLYLINPLCKVRRHTTVKEPPYEGSKDYVKAAASRNDAATFELAVSNRKYTNLFWVSLKKCINNCKCQIPVCQKHARVRLYLCACVYVCHTFVIARRIIWVLTSLLFSKYLCTTVCARVFVFACVFMFIGIFVSSSSLAPFPRCPFSLHAQY